MTNLERKIHSIYSKEEFIRNIYTFSYYMEIAQFIRKKLTKISENIFDLGIVK